MEIPFSIAHMVGVYFIAVGLACLFDPKRIVALGKDALKSPGVMMSFSLICFLFGFLILESYNSWTADMAGLLTLLGWLSVLKGIFLLVFPAVAENAFDFFSGGGKKTGFYQGVGVAAIILGAYILYTLSTSMVG